MSRRTQQVQRQRLGLRPSLEPYYQMVEHTPTRLLLESRPNANAGAGRVFGGCGLVLVVLSLCVLSGSYSTGQDVTTTLAGIITALPCAVIGSLGLMAGLTIGTTRNTITVDTEAGTLHYTQSNRLARRTRTQALALDHIARLRFHPRPFQPPGMLRRQRTIVALEAITHDEDVWLVDSAEVLEALTPTADALSAVLQLPVGYEADEDDEQGEEPPEALPS
jgi:hypothetical protein